VGRAMSLPGDLWPGVGPQPPDRWKDPDEFESEDGFLLSLRLRFLLSSGASGSGASRRRFRFSIKPPAGSAPGRVALIKLYAWIRRWA
jgi:hypothetical protein